MHFFYISPTMLNSQQPILKQTEIINNIDDRQDTNTARWIRQKIAYVYLGYCMCFPRKGLMQWNKLDSHKITSHYASHEANDVVMLLDIQNECHSRGVVRLLGLLQRVVMNNIMGNMFWRKFNIYSWTQTQLY